MGNEKVTREQYVFKRISSIDIALIEDFTCGSEELDQKLRQMRASDEGTTFVFLDVSENQVIGYCTYCASGLTLCAETDRVTQPASEIKYFAVNAKYQHRSFDEDFNFSDLMLCKVIARLYEISEDVIAFDHILLYSVPEAVSFYRRNGFKHFSDYMEEDSYLYIHGCVPMVYHM